MWAASELTGAVAYSGTNASQIIQSAIDGTFSKGRGHVHIKEGDYDITNTIILRNGITLTGKYKWTQLKAKNLAGDILKTADGAQNIQVENLVLWGRRDQADGQSSGNGLYIYGDGSGYRARISNLIISHVKENGIKIGGSNGQTTGTDMHIFNNAISNNGEDGIHVGTATGSGNDIVIESNTIHENVGHGIHSQYGSGLQVIGNNIYGNHEEGILDESEGQNLYENNKINANYKEGIKAGYPNRNQYIGNQLISNSYLGDNLYAQLRIESFILGRARYNIVKGNYIGNYPNTNPKAHCGILLGGRADYNIISGNILPSDEFYTKAMVLVGSNNIVKDNIGFVTENSGTATIANNEWVPHGLASTPTVVIVTTRTPTYGLPALPVIIGVVRQNATHFQVSAYLTNGKAITADAINISWHAEYKP